MKVACLPIYGTSVFVERRIHKSIWLATKSRRCRQAKLENIHIQH
jgi:hypothetical protein